MQQWEYRAIDLNGTSPRGTSVDALNRAGHEGGNWLRPRWQESLTSSGPLKSPRVENRQ